MSFPLYFEKFMRMANAIALSATIKDRVTIVICVLLVLFVDCIKFITLASIIISILIIIGKTCVFIKINIIKPEVIIIKGNILWISLISLIKILVL